MLNQPEFNIFGDSDVAAALFILDHICLDTFVSEKKPAYGGLKVVAGAGFEPAAFRL